jgi:phage terminase large subunit-like protein
MKNTILHTLKNALEAELNRRESILKQYNWHIMARSKQRLPEGDWHTWLILAGRGFGKTRTGAESIRQLVMEKHYRHIALIAKSLHEARRIMVEGESGLLAISPKNERPIFYPSKRMLVWPNGAQATLFGADQPDQLRGPQFDAAWVDEWCKFRYPQACLDQLSLALRLGKHPRSIITTTPRPMEALKNLMDRDNVHITQGTTFENKDNLAQPFLTHLTKHLANTRLGSQELYAHILEEIQGALWTPSMIVYKEAPKTLDTATYNLKRIVISIDPATTHHDKSDETGIMVCGVDEHHQAFVLEDLSGRHSPSHWGQMVVEAYWRYKADRVVAETNKGGDLVEKVLRAHDPHVSFKEVRATRGKAVRAEPVAALYEKKRVFHHMPLPLLEKQLCAYVPGITRQSPDRLDALVWGITDLLLEKEASPFAKIW